MNLLIQMGRLTRDVETSSSQSGDKVIEIAKFWLAVDKQFKRDGQPTADFFNYTAFGKMAEFASKYLHKGSKVVITGRVENNEYKDKEGKTVKTNNFIADRIEFAESKAASQQNATQSNPTESSRPSADSFMPVSGDLEEELPFS